MQQQPDIGIYIHIPFCKQRCRFCAFYLEVAGTERKDSFCAALTREIDFYRRHNVIGPRRVRSLYFGGGTPTALPACQLASLLELAKAAWPTDSSTEITVEAHPSTVTATDLQILAGAGFTRISFGVESMEGRDFVPIGRPGRVQDTITSVKAARAAGFQNINLDLMYGLPGQTLASWLETLKKMLSLEPSHVSCYALTIEENTPLAQDIARNLLPRPDEDLQLEMESAAETLLCAAGFERYEISNYALPGYASRHNTLYWTGGEYLGLGPSAQSYIGGIRFGNVADTTAYVRRLRAGQLPIAEQTHVTDEEQRRDNLVFGLRLIQGVPRSLVRYDMPQHQTLVSLTNRGLIEWKEDRICLTPLGRRFADSVAEELF